MRLIGVVCAALVAMLAGGGRAQAALFTYDFVATVGAMADDPGNAHFNFQTGDQIAFSFTLTDQSVSQPLVGFTVNGAPGFFGAFQDVVIADPAPDADPGTFDFLHIFADGPQAPSILIRFTSAGDSAFDPFSGAFPATIDPTRFDEAIFEYRIALDTVFATGTLDRIAPVAGVPEPTPLATFGAALLVVTIWTRLRRRKAERPSIAD